MEAGKTKLSDKIIKLDTVDAMIQGADQKFLMSKAIRLNVLRAQPVAPAQVCSPRTP